MGWPWAGEPVGPVGVPAEIVEQGPVAQRGRAAGPAARGEQRRAAHRQQRLLVEGFLQQRVLAPGQRARRGGLASIGEPGVEVTPRRVDAPMVGLELDGDAGMGRLERGEPRQQPLLGHCLDRDDAHPPGGGALLLGDAVDLGQDALDLLEIGPAAAVEVHAPAPSLEQLSVQMLLQGADAVADGCGGNPELPCRPARSSGGGRRPRRSAGCRAGAGGTRRRSERGPLVKRDCDDDGVVHQSTRDDGMTEAEPEPTP